MTAAGVQTRSTESITIFIHLEVCHSHHCFRKPPSKHVDPTLDLCVPVRRLSLHRNTFILLFFSAAPRCGRFDVCSSPPARLDLVSMESICTCAHYTLHSSVSPLLAFATVPSLQRLEIARHDALLVRRSLTALMDEGSLFTPAAVWPYMFRYLGRGRG